jgi:hypothetical protein
MTTALIIVEAGTRFCRYTVIDEAPRYRKPSGASTRLLNCRCDCGVVKSVRLTSLRTGSTVSCGCFHKEQATALGKAARTHGQSKTRVYWIWQAMISRCHDQRDKSYPRYGGRGTSVCQEWRDSFESFSDHMGPRPEGLTLDRINSGGNYEPGNMRWATYKQQARNTRRNHLYTMNGETRCLAEWCEITGEPWSTVKKRVAAGRDPFQRLRPDRRLS